MTIDWPLIGPPVRHILGRYLKVARLTLIAVALVVLASAVTAIVAPYLFSRLIDEAADTQDLRLVLYGFFAYALLLGISAALSRMVNYLSFMTAESLSYITSTTFFDKLLRKTTRFFIDHNPAEIQSAQQQGQQALHVFIQLGLIAFIPSIVQIVLALGLVGAVVSFEIALVVFAYGAGFIGLTYWVSHVSRGHLEAAIKAMQENARFVGNAIGGMETLRQFGSDRWLSGRFFDKAGEVLSNWRRFALMHVGFSAVFGLALAVQFALTFFFLWPRYEAGTLSLGDLVLINALLIQLNAPFEMIGQAIDSLIRAYARLLPFARMWGAEEEPDVATNSGLAIGEGVLAVEGAGFRYENGRGVEGADFVARRGAITFLTGETGSGKSTVFRMILKGMEPSTGRITLDGEDIADISREAWFAHVAAVPQDVVLLNDTLAINIVLGRAFNADRLRQAADEAAILPFIEGLEEGFETVVGERGLKLSGGERQRIAIARALYGNPALLLLDEASSALDEATEKDIMAHLRTVAHRVTILAITHRLSVIGAHDKVVSLDVPARETEMLETETRA